MEGTFINSDIHGGGCLSYNSVGAGNDTFLERDLRLVPKDRCRFRCLTSLTETISPNFLLVRRPRVVRQQMQARTTFLIHLFI